MKKILGIALIICFLWTAPLSASSVKSISPLLKSGNDVWMANTSDKLAIGHTDPNASLDILIPSASATGIMIKGADSQSGDYLQVKDPNNVELFIVEADGDVIVAGTTSRIGNRRAFGSTGCTTQAEVLAISGNYILEFTEDHTMTGDWNIPTRIVIDFSGGAKIKTNNYDLTIHNQMYAGQEMIIQVDANSALPVYRTGSVKEINSRWFGCEGSGAGTALNFTPKYDPRFDPNFDTMDWAGIQISLDVAEASDVKTVYTPTGDYIVTKCLFIDGNDIVWKGDGYNQTVVRQDANASPHGWYAETNDDSQVKIGGRRYPQQDYGTGRSWPGVSSFGVVAHNVTVKEIGIIGDRDGFASSGWYNSDWTDPNNEQSTQLYQSGIQPHGPSSSELLNGIKLYQLRCSGHAECGIEPSRLNKIEIAYCTGVDNGWQLIGTDNGFHNGWIHHCYSDDPADATAEASFIDLEGGNGVDYENILISDNNVGGPDAGFLKLHPGAPRVCRNIIVENNISRCVGETYSFIETYGGHIYGLNITNNTVSEAKHHLISFGSSETVEDVLIENNQFSVASGSDSAYGIRLGKELKRVLIRGNTIDVNSLQRPFVVGDSSNSHTTEPCEDITIENNYVINNASGRCVHGYLAKNLKVINNTFECSGTAAGIITNVTESGTEGLQGRCEFSGNKFSGLTGYGIDAYCPEWDSNSTVIIERNEIRTATYPIRIRNNWRHAFVNDNYLEWSAGAYGIYPQSSTTGMILQVSGNEFRAGNATSPIYKSDTDIDILENLNVFLGTYSGGTYLPTLFYPDGLILQSDNYETVIIERRSPGDSMASLVFKNSDADKAAVALDNNDLFYISNDSREIYITPTGIGVETSDPNGIFDVNGTILSTGLNLRSGTITNAGDVTSTGTMEAATITEGGNAVYNSSETPGGELGGTWASPTIDDNVAVTGWNLTTPTITTSATVSDGGTIGLGSGKGLIQFDDETTDFVSFSNCNVGIGTTGPGAKLDIQLDTAGGLSENLYLANRAAANVANSAALSFRFKRTGEAENTYGKISVTSVDITSPSEDGAMGFDVMTGGSTNTRVMTLISGNVGIGTTEPDKLLHLEKTGTVKTNNELLKLTNTGNAANMSDTLTGILFEQSVYDPNLAGSFSTARIQAYTDTNCTNTGSTQDGGLKFETALDGALTGAMVINSAGNVGIGTTNPYSSSKLTIEGDSNDLTDYVVYTTDNLGRVTSCINNQGRLDQFSYESQGPPHVLYYDTNSPANDQEAGHYAFGLRDSVGQFNTIAFIVGTIKDITHTSLDSQLDLFYMDDVDATAGYSQPNKAVTINSSGFNVPAIPITGATALTASSNGSWFGTEQTEGEAITTHTVLINNSSSGSDNLLLTNGGAGGLASSIQFRGTPSNFASMYSAGQITGGWSGTLAEGYATSFLNFGTATANNTFDTDMTITSGNVGIGTTGPNAELEISSTSPGLSISNTTETDNGTRSVSLKSYHEMEDTTKFQGGEITFYHDSNDADKDTAIIFKNNDGADADGALTERMVIDSTGNVGIGTTAPGYDLEVAGTSNVAYFGDSNDGLLIQQGSVVSLIGINQVAGTYNDIQMRAGSSGSGVYVKTGGNVGIGTTDPNCALNVNGNTQINGNVNPDADGTRDLGTQTTAQWANVWSDLINGSDYSFLNNWRLLESEKYKGYPVGIAIGNEGFKPGIVTDKMPEGIKPILVITEEFIEYQGIRITAEQFKKLSKLLKL